MAPRNRLHELDPDVAEWLRELNVRLNLEAVKCPHQSHVEAKVTDLVTGKTLLTITRPTSIEATTVAIQTLTKTTIACS